MRVLVSAYACEPGKGSEPGVGWNQAKQIARFHDVWVITRSKNRSVIEEALAKEPIPNISWVYFDFPRWARFWKQGRTGTSLYYHLWQLGAYLVARRLHQEVRFNVAHHVTFVNYWMPTFLPFLRIPFIWGPVGGGESVPRGFRRTFSLRGKIHEVLRDIARSLGEHNPLVRLAARRTAIGLATTDQTERRLWALGCRKVAVMPAVGLPAEELRQLSAFPIRQSSPFRVLSVGDLLHLKGFELGLRAFALFHVRFPQSEYWLVGDGPERKRLERLAREMKLNGAVVFWGKIPRQQVFARLAECNVLLFPSLHDSGGYASLEAMAAGLPLICLDLGGPALQVTRETGIKVPADSPEQVVENVAMALVAFSGDSARCLRMGRLARERVRELFCWDNKGNLIRDIYSQVTSNGGGRSC